MVTLRVQVLHTGTISNTATAIPANVEANLANNSATATTKVLLRSGPCANRKVGTAGNDTLNGTPKGDLLQGLSGNDKLFVGIPNGIGFQITGAELDVAVLSPAKPTSGPQTASTPCGVSRRATR